jgi:hypothetical protein
MLAIFAGEGVMADFFPDEMMNMYFAQRESVAALLKANVLFFEGHSRPMGALFYNLLFKSAGLDPLSYRLVCFTFLLANLAITWLLLKELSGSPSVTAAGTLLASYHAYLADLYYSSATCYDILCYFFYYLALLFYVWRRRRGRLQWRELAVFALIYLGALSSKEMAVTLPVIAAGFELLYMKTGLRDWRGPAFSALLACAVTAPALLGGNSLLSSSVYTPSWDLLASNAGHYLGMLLYVHEVLDPHIVCLIAVVLLALAIGLRSPDIRLAVLIVFVTPLPVLFIAQRNLYAWYIPLFGWALLFAVVLKMLAGAVKVPDSPGWAVLLCLCCFAVLYPLHRHRQPFGTVWVPAEMRKVRTILDQLNRELPSIRPGSLVLMADDPFAKDDYILTFIFRLNYRDDRIDVDRAMGRPPLPRGDGRAYDYVLDLREWRLKVIRTPPAREPYDPSRNASPAA